MYHSVTFGEMNSWDDWHLIPSTRPVFNPPNVKTQYVDIPGGNGSLDLTEALTGYPTYENRTGSIEFYVANGYEDWDILYSKIMNYLHGKELRAYLEDDRSFVYVGRFEVNQWKSDKWWSTITIDYNVYPFKKEQTGFDDWLWDPFDFENDIIRNYSDIVVNGDYSTSIVIDGRYERVVPEFTVSSDDGEGIVVTFQNNNYRFEDGTSANPNIVIGESNETLTFSGYGSISITYIGGSL